MKRIEAELSGGLFTAFQFSNPGRQIRRALRRGRQQCNGVSDFGMLTDWLEHTVLLNVEL
jgi:hypothetical protein